ncbi:unnamed protein product [Pleuronectes platessa]|uniref:Uncharacterized protein n=1 Tax=Pleuronectes platessa TaxID=8262 RepID=A0A9N7TNU7_PLEPL|nr:unnamed protein product [Pleuronectes platessa]
MHRQTADRPNTGAAPSVPLLAPHVWPWCATQSSCSPGSRSRSGSGSGSSSRSRQTCAFLHGHGQQAAEARDLRHQSAAPLRTFQCDSTPSSHSPHPPTYTQPPPPNSVRGKTLY